MSENNDIHLQQAYNGQKLIHQEILKTLSTLSKEGARKTLASIEACHGAITTLWEEFERNDSTIRDSDEMKITDEYFTKDTYDTVKKVYENGLAKMDNYKLTLAARPSTSKMNLGDNTKEKKSTRDTSPQEMSDHEQDQQRRMQKQRSTMKLLGNILNQVNCQETKSKAFWGQKISQINNYWKRIQLIQEDIAYFTNEEDITEITEDYQEMENWVLGVLIEIDEVNQQGHGSRTEQVPMVSLPPIKLPTFNGDYNAWHTFHDLFVKTIHENCKIGSVVKLQYLKTNITGDAEKLLAHLPICDQNYEIAWSALCTRFNNKRKLLSTYIESILAQPVCKFGSAVEIKSLHDKSKESLQAINKLGLDTTSWGPILLHLLIKKLDKKSLLTYEESLANPRNIQQLEEFLKFLEGRFMTLEAVEGNEIASSGRQWQTTSKPKTCLSCNDDHYTFICDAFNKLNVEQRNKLVRDKRGCTGCLNPSHKIGECKNTKVCKNCGGRHHTLLHRSNSTNQKSTASTSSALKQTEQKKQSEKVERQTCFAEGTKQVLLATALVHSEAADGSNQVLRVLIDSGSQATLITEAAVQRIGANKHKTMAKVSGIGDGSKTVKHEANITLKPHFASRFSLTTTALVLKRLTSEMPTDDINSNNWKHINELLLADPGFNKRGPIDMILGADTAGQVMQQGLTKGPKNTPMAQSTEFGWVVFGESVTEAEKSNRKHVHVVEKVNHNNIEFDLKRFWELNEIETLNNTGEEEACEEKYRIDTKRTKNGKYVVKFPFKDIPEMGESRNMAVATMLHMEKRFNKDPALRQKYTQFMKEYIELGHMKPCARSDFFSGSNVRPNYLPHHAVFKDDSTTTKLRVVFDASRKTTNGKSLNDWLMVGPRVQQELATIMMRWRRHRIVFSADIEKMYRQILMDRKETNYQRIVWRDSDNQPIRDFCLQTVTYGTSSAPFLAIRTLNQLAQDEKQRFPEASKIITSDFYVDDVLSGAETENQAMQLQRDLWRLLQTGGFKLRKWTSNSQKLLEQIPINEREIAEIEINKEASVKTLGIIWNPATDSFSYKTNIGPDIKPTKRTILSEMSKIFDPLGWIAPIIIKPKILMQEMWIAECTWDDKPPEYIRTEWQKIKNQFKCIEQIKIPRWIQYTSVDTVELYGFSDASEKAYAAAIYSRTVNGDGKVKITLLVSKTKVAPVKKITLPRLELCGAKLLAQLMTVAVKALEIENIKTNFYTDSEIVLAWIRGNPAKWKVFVSNCITEILRHSKVQDWKHVKSEENPADVASRGIYPEDLQNHQLWWTGPAWLHEPIINRPQKDVRDTELEAKKVKVHVAMLQNEHENRLIDRYSSLSKLLRITALCERFIQKLKIRRNGNRGINSELSETEFSEIVGSVTAPELVAARNKLIKVVQDAAYQDDIRRLTSTGHVNNSSSLRSLNPFLDKNRLVRVGGRIQHSDLSFSQKHQIILPQSGTLTCLIIRAAHERTLHGGITLTTAALRQEYWIIRGNNAIKKIIRSCIVCFRQNSKRTEQLMGSIPKPRLSVTRPFTHTGVDYASPISLTTLSGRGGKHYKGYIAVFICLSTKAIHIEAVVGLTAEAFLAAYKRLTGRRGQVSHLYSDNGTNFVLANKILQMQEKNEIDTFNESIHKHLASVGTRWHFIPPASPHFGGIWEAGVKSVKHHLKRTIGHSTLTYEEMSTLLVQVEASLNSRPLCPLSTDPGDLEVLTPGHFLIGAPLLAPPETDVMDINMNRLSRWQHVRRIHQHFWKRWSDEYLTRLQQRPKWLTKKENIKTGDLVLINRCAVTLTTIKEECPLQQASRTKINYIRTSASLQTAWSIVVMIFFALTTMTCATTQNPFRIEPFINQPGIYFEEAGTLALSNSEWHIIVYYKLANYYGEFDKIESSIYQLEMICNHAARYGINPVRCNGIINQLDAMLIETKESNKILGHSKNNLSDRKRRSPLDIIGTVQNRLFGVLDQDDAQKFEAQIEALKTNEQHLNNLIRNQTTIQDATLNILKHTQEAIDKHFEAFGTHVDTIMHNAEAKHNATETLHILALQATLMLIRYQAKQNLLLDVILSTHDGKVHPLIITPTQMEKQLNLIRKNLPADMNIPEYDGTDGLLRLYKLLSVKSRFSKMMVIVDITLPLTRRERFQLFREWPVATVHDGQLVSIQQSTKYLAVTLDRNNYYQIETIDLHACTILQQQQYICKQTRPIHNVLSDQSRCEMDLLAHKNELSPLCKFQKHSAHIIWSQLLHDNSWIYATIEPTTIDIICENKVHNTVVKNNGIIILQAKCTIKQTTMTLTSNSIQQSSLTSSFLPAINLTGVLNVSNNFKDFSEFQEQSLATKMAGGEMAAIKQQIKEQRKAEEKPLTVMDTLTVHDVHHYITTYVLALFVAIMLAMAVYHRRKKMLINQNRPTPAPRIHTTTV